MSKKKPEKEGFQTTEIVEEKTLGVELQEARKARLLTIEEAERVTKIRKKYLLALEKNNFSALPPGTFGRGLLSTYAKFLGISTHRFADIFPQKGHGKLLSSAPAKKFVISPRTFVWLGVIILGLVVFSYIIFQVAAFSVPPKLTLVRPAQNAQISSDQVVVEGQTDISAEVFINGEPVKTDLEGRFREQVNLSSGQNILKITARSRLGKETIVERIVVAK